MQVFFTFFMHYFYTIDIHIVFSPSIPFGCSVSSTRFRSQPVYAHRQHFILKQSDFITAAGIASFQDEKGLPCFQAAQLCFLFLSNQLIFV